MPVSAAEVREAFLDRLKTLRCPHCDAQYTDRAVAWCEGWLEGRRDALREFNRQERDGPIKLECEVCAGRATTNPFFSPPKPVQGTTD